VSDDRRLVSVVGEVAEQLSHGALNALVAALRKNGGSVTLEEAVPNPHYRDAVRDLREAWARQPEVDSGALALALECAGERQQAVQRRRLSIVWTGPPTEAVPVRRTDQALLELVKAAERRLIVVSFAVYKVPAVAEALIAAASRGVSVAVVLESEAESGGKVNYEMAEALGSEVAEHATIYTWPAELRPKTSKGKRASLHAKCAVADAERLLVSSANLTEFALTLNIELGLLVEGDDTARRVQDHLEALIETGTLIRVTSGTAGR
jgi:phosphatidylserine/phosphatidylglycerophosphate/cardiolipin synthase-like enzyme